MRKHRFGLALKGVKPADEWQLRMHDRERRLEDMIRKACEATHVAASYTDGGSQIGVMLEVDKFGFHFERGIKFPDYLTDEQIVAGCQYRVGRYFYDVGELLEHLGDE